MRERRVILHPTDYSEQARQAFDMACRIARNRGDRLIVMHVVEPVRSSALGMAPTPPLPKGYRGAWQSRLRLVRPTDAGLPIEHRLEEGDVAAAIVRVAREVPCDLIVMGERQRTWLERLLHRIGLDRLFGRSITAQVRRDSPCPVVTVKLPHDRHTYRMERGTNHEASDPHRSERPDEPGATRSPRAAGEAPVEWTGTKLSPEMGKSRPRPAGARPHVLCKTARATRSYGCHEPPDRAE